MTDCQEPRVQVWSQVGKDNGTDARCTSTRLRNNTKWEPGYSGTFVYIRYIGSANYALIRAKFQQNIYLKHLSA